MRDFCVLLPFRNAETTLSRAALSVVNQSLVPNRVLLINDNSVDASYAIARRLAAAVPVIDVIHSDGVGIADALNTGIACTSEPLIARMDADDLACFTRFATQWNVMRKQQLDVCGTQVRQIFSTRVMPRIVLRYPTLIADPRADFWTVRTPVAHMSTLIRRSALDLVGGYNPGLNRAQDYELWLRMQTFGLRLGNTANVLMRISRDSKTWPAKRLESIAYSAWAVEGVADSKLTSADVLRDLETLRRILFSWAHISDANLMRHQIGKRLPNSQQIMASLAWLLGLASRESRRWTASLETSRAINSLRRRYFPYEVAQYARMTRYISVQ